jgi:UDP:flavonoid glycosyltransferase YjiC (YdhE family)
LFLDRPADWQPPSDLGDFLAAGSPPVYIGFGSAISLDPEARTKLVLEALACTGQRGILATGWGGLSNSDLPDSVFQIEAVPHDWLFPQMAAVVHHGGAGTTAAGLRAGVPSIIVPFVGDESFWGQQIANLGVGPSPIPQEQLSVEQLTTAIHTATNDQAMRDRAVTLGQKIREEDGVARTVEAFHCHLSSL